MITKILLGSLAAWRASALLVLEDGPFDIFVRIRAAAGVYDLGRDGQPETATGRFLSCISCVSVWVSAVVALMLFELKPVELVLGWLAVSAGAMVVHSFAWRE